MLEARAQLVSFIHYLYVLVPQEPNLRATQYLPGIVRLQQCLYDNFHHRLDRKEARAMTIGEFLQSRKHGNISITVSPTSK